MYKLLLRMLLINKINNCKSMNEIFFMGLKSNFNKEFEKF